MIAPGDIVGKCGGTGTGGASVYTPHLHITYYNVDNKDFVPNDSVDSIIEQIDKNFRRNPLNTEDIRNDNRAY